VVVAWRTERAVPQASLLVSDTHALILLEGAAPGSGQAWWDVSADLDRCPLTDLVGSVTHGVSEGGVAVVMGLRTGPCRGPVTMIASSPEGRVASTLRPRALPRPRALASAWARARVGWTADPAEIRALGLRWGIVTAETSLVAVDPGAEGVKVARMTVPPPDTDGDGLLDAMDAPLVQLSEARIVLLDAPPPEAEVSVARRRPRGKTPLLLGGVVALGGGAALCALAGPDARGPACAGGVALGVVGLGAAALGVAR
jgi:hypothetical protein